MKACTRLSYTCKHTIVLRVSHPKPKLGSVFKKTATCQAVQKPDVDTVLSNSAPEATYNQAEEGDNGLLLISDVELGIWQDDLLGGEDDDGVDEVELLGSEDEEGTTKPGQLVVNESRPDGRERVFLVGVTLKAEQQRIRAGGSDKLDIAESLEELGRLADTAGLQVVGSAYQVLASPNNATYIGSGKVAEVAAAVAAYDVDTVIFDDELSPGQLRNLEKAFRGEANTEVQVCDRTALILDIFSQRAQTKEGKLQVELAQTEYQLPRLTRMWSHLDRVGGGGQVKGTGEKQKEIDRRLLRDKAIALRRELEDVRGHRRSYRDRRAETPIPVVAIVGYTNAGKSTLLNTLTQAGVLAEDKLFATLDPTTRRIRLKGNKELLISDTVGFIQKLPTELVAAFRATLEEIQDASVVLHVMDISHPDCVTHSNTVLKVLADLDVAALPLVTAWNKIDACADPDQVRAAARSQPTPTVCISGRSGAGVDELLAVIGDALARSLTPMTVLLPYSAGDLVDAVFSVGVVASHEYVEAGVAMQCAVPRSLIGRLAQYSTDPAQPASAGPGAQAAVRQ